MKIKSSILVIVTQITLIDLRFQFFLERVMLIIVIIMLEMEFEPLTFISHCL